MDYLPKMASIAETCEWLHKQTGQKWVLQRLMEHGLRPYFWLDYSAGAPFEIFGDRKEGYLASMAFAGDTHRLEIDATDALVTMSFTHDGKVFKTEPGIRVPLSDLRFKREEIERAGEITNTSKQAQPQAASAKAGTAQRWTPEFTSEVRAYRDSHTERQTAEKFGVSGALIRRKLAEMNSTSKPNAGPFSGLGKRSR